MTDYSFEAKIREKDAKNLRAEGYIPAIIYGKDFENLNLMVDGVLFARLYKEAGGSNIVNLNIEGKNTEKVLINDVQIDPVSDDILHIDFYKINMKQKITTEIPLKYTGESPLVVEKEGSFITNKSEIEVECLPTDLVDHIDVDISVLTDFEQNLKVSDIKVPTGIEILDDPEEVIALVQPPRSEEELEALEEEVVEDIESVEVEEKGKEEEGEEDEESAENEDGKKKDEEKDDKSPKLDGKKD